MTENKRAVLRDITSDVSYEMMGMWAQSYRNGHLLSCYWKLVKVTLGIL